MNLDALNLPDLPRLPVYQLYLLPEVSCVYFVMSPTSILYIGQTGNLRQRMPSHQHLQHFRSTLNVRVAWLEVGENERLDVERAAIAKFIPELNDNIAKKLRIKRDRQIAKEKRETEYAERLIKWIEAVKDEARLRDERLRDEPYQWSEDAPAVLLDEYGPQSPDDILNRLAVEQGVAFDGWNWKARITTAIRYGLCIGCGMPSQRAKCRNCKEVENALVFLRGLDNQLQGVCKKCGKQRNGESLHCEACLLYGRRSNRLRHAFRLVA